MMSKTKAKRVRIDKSVRSYGDRLLMIAANDLQPYRRNARTHSARQIRQIADSIERFGFTNPVLIDDDNMILAGHGRVEAAKRLGMQEVPCLRLAAMSEAEKRVYILADNKIASCAGWDEDLLAAELEFILAEVEEIDIGLTGFSISEIDMILDTGETGPAYQDADDDIVPDLPTAAPVTRRGDVWQLGDHRLVCGDARDRADYQRLMVAVDGHAELAQMVFTGPPYNVPIRGHVSSSKRIGHREFVMGSGEMDRRSFEAFLADVFAQMVEWSCDGSIHFICMDWRHIDEISRAGRGVYSELKNLIVWVKDNGGMGSFYRSRHELIFAFKNGTAPHINSFELGQNGRYRTNVWNYRGITSATKDAREALALHPTVKPVAMVADAMKDCSSRGGLVLDPFCGSGTVLIAAQKTGRRARAMELDPLYCDTAIVRWQQFAGDDAILVESGQSFEAVTSQRAEHRLSPDGKVREEQAAIDDT